MYNIMLIWVMRVNFDSLLLFKLIDYVPSTHRRGALRVHTFHRLIGLVAVPLISTRNLFQTIFFINVGLNAKYRK